jgi:type VI protein secretion system component VasK
MQPDAASYVGFLALGALAVCLDALLIRRSGATYLAEVYPARTTADSVNRLITVLFCLSMLGALAVVSVLDLPFGFGLPNLVLRLGILFLVMAAAHGVTVWVLARMRGERYGLRLHDETAHARKRLNEIPAASVQETEVQRTKTTRSDGASSAGTARSGHGAVP